MQPTTSYWPPTRSPGCSLGVNENGVPHFGQNPSVRPGCPPRQRPTGSPHSEQNRFSSATSGLAMTTDCGSGTGADGTVVIPAPRCWIRLSRSTRRRVGRLRPARAEPMGVLDSLVETRGMRLRRWARTRRAAPACAGRASRRRCSTRPRSGRCSPAACTLRGSRRLSFRVRLRSRRRPAPRAGTPPPVGARSGDVARRRPQQVRAPPRTPPSGPGPRRARCARRGPVGTEQAAEVVTRRQRCTVGMLGFRRAPVRTGRVGARTRRAARGPQPSSRRRRSPPRARPAGARARMRPAPRARADRRSGLGSVRPAPTPTRSRPPARCSAAGTRRTAARSSARRLASLMRSRSRRVTATSTSSTVARISSRTPPATAASSARRLHVERGRVDAEHLDLPTAPLDRGADGQDPVGDAGAADRVGGQRRVQPIGECGHERARLGERERGRRAERDRGAVPT